MHKNITGTTSKHSTNLAHISTLWTYSPTAFSSWGVENAVLNSCLHAALGCAGLRGCPWPVSGKRPRATYLPATQAHGLSMASC